MADSRLAGLGSPLRELQRVVVPLTAALVIALGTTLAPIPAALVVGGVIALCASLAGAGGPAPWVFALLVSKPLVDLTWRWRFFELFGQEINLQTAVAVFVIGFAGLTVLLQRRAQPFNSRLVPALVASAALSVALSPSGQAVNELVRLLSGVSFFFVAVYALRDEEDFTRFALTLILAVFVPVGLSFGQLAGVLPFEYWDYIGPGESLGRVSGTYQHPLGLIYFLIFAIPLALFLLEPVRARSWHAIVAAGFVLAASAALVFTYHRTALVTMTIVYLAWLILSHRYGLALGLALLVSVVAVAFSDTLAFLYQNVAEILQGRVEFSSGDFLRGRGMQWYLFLFSWLSGGPVSWLFGKGGSVAEGFVPFFGFWVSDEPHNDFIRLGHAYGLVGLGIYLAVLGSFFRSALRLRRRVSRFLQDLGAVMIVVLISVGLLSMTGEPMRYPTGVWYLFALGALVTYFDGRAPAAGTPGDV